MVYNILFISFFIVIGSCRPAPTQQETKEQNRKKLDQLLKIGRQPGSIQGKESTPSLSLTNDPIVRQYKTEGSEELSRILYNTSLMESVSYKDLERYALNFIVKLEPALHVKASELSRAAVFETRAKEDLLTLNYERSFEDVPVKNALFTFLFTKVSDDTYKLMGIRNRSYGHINLENAGATLPLDADLELYTGISGLEVENSSVMIFPRNETEGMKFYSGKQWQVTEPETGDLLSIFVAAGNFELLEASTNRYFQHKFQALSYQKNYLEAAKTPSPLSFIPVTNNQVFTDGDGVAVIAPGSNPNTLTLEGERFKIVDGTNLNLSNQNIANLNTAALPAISLLGQTVGDVTTFTSNSDAEEQGLTTLRGIQQIQQVVRRHLTPAQTTLLDRPIVTFVNAPDSCNAFYFGNKLRDHHLMVFFREGTSQQGTNCGSTGLLADVAAHEWCHALDDFTGPQVNNSGITDPSFSEGIGDICSAYMSGSPGLGSGFFLNSPNTLRTVANDNVYPGDFLTGQNFSPHFNGLIIGGAFWQLWLGLSEKYGPEKGPHMAESLFFRHLLDTQDFLSSYDSVLILDDDDGNPATPSPNFCVINAAFANHGLATAEPNCVDDPITAKSFPANLDLFFGVETDAAGVSRWVGSGEEVAQIELCMGGPETCLLPTAQTIVLPHSGKLAGRDYFTSLVPATLLPYTEITIISTHYYGNKSYRNYVTSPK